MMRVVFSLAAIQLLLGCSTEVQIVTAPPELPPDAAPSLEGCATPILIPTGKAWVGGLDWVGGQLTRIGCDESGGFATLNLVVPNVFLDDAEVANACYRQCVDAGECEPPLPVPAEGGEPWPLWDEPAMHDVPTQLLDNARTDAFCRWRGGRVPTLAELQRAANGDALTIFNPKLMELWLECVEGSPTPCARANRPNDWPAPSRGWELDRGPFGHYDVAGSVIELTQTGLPATGQELDELDALCRAIDAPDPRTFGTGDRAGFNSVNGNLPRPPFEGAPYISIVGGSLNGGPIMGGVRCAYDPL